MKSGSGCFALLLLLSTVGAQATTPADTPASPAIEVAEKQDNTPPENMGTEEAKQVEPKAVQTKPETEQTAAVEQKNATEEPVFLSEKEQPEADQNSDAAVVAPATTKPEQEQTLATTAEPEPEPEMSMTEVITLLKQQQKELSDQKQLLDSQSRKIANLTRELDVLRAPPPSEIEQIVAKSDQATQPVDTSAKTLTEQVESPKTEEQKDTEAGEAIAKAQTDDPTRALLEDFKGAWRLPGTNAALAIGGFVKTSIVYNFDPLEIKDRFIVGSIPVGDSEALGIEAQSSITASQSRLNFDLREPTDFGLLRAFIEADFAEENDTFRLRHAFGQWKSVLAGKTWSAFVDTEASPEEVDFEGLNGRVNVRQSQIRVMPKLGDKYEFQVSMEDPNPQVQNGSGVTRAPDFVFTGRIQPHERLHIKLAMLARQIRAQRISGGGGVEKEYAWGTSVSGRFMTPNLDDRDSLLFQLNAGNGIGRYVNDLSSVGNFDGIFDPDTGDLELFDILSGYISWQHWWGRNQMRSNFTFGAVNVDNPNFVDDNAYKRTLRLSSNLFWSPTPRIDIGGEYLWGNRKNENGKNDDATQIQLSVRYRF